MTFHSETYRWLADLVLVVHFSFVAFVIVGFVVIWAGFCLQRPFIRNFYFRLAHILAMSLVLLESLGGVTCPLTAWEGRLRLLAGEGQHYAGSFIQHWLHRIMFFEFSESTFTVIYVLFFALIVATFWFIPPRRPSARKANPG